MSYPRTQNRRPEIEPGPPHSETSAQTLRFDAPCFSICLGEEIRHPDKRIFLFMVLFIYCFFVDGDFDTPSSAVTKQTYLPSLLYFHEEIMHALNVTPTVPKKEPDRRDLMMKEIEKAANWDVAKKTDGERSLMDKMYFTFTYYSYKIKQFLRIDKL